MEKDLYQNTGKKGFGEKRRRIKKRENRIIGIAVLGLVFVACGASSGRMDGNPGGWEDSAIENGSDMKSLPEEGDIGEGSGDGEDSGGAAGEKEGG